MTQQILVVGCGPTGLTLTGLLKRHGVEVTVIDKYPGVLKATKAAAIHARALEVLDVLGVADPIVREGHKVEFLNLRTQHKDRLILRFDELTDTKYPFMIDLPQYRTEELLIDRLQAMGVTLRRAVELTELREQDGRVHVTLQRTDPDGHEPVGAPEHHVYDYVIGCDGVHSTVRSQIGQDFVGETYADPWCLTDAQVDWPISRNEMTFSSDDTGICGMFPLPKPGQFRVVYTQWFDSQGKPIPPDRENMQRAIARTGFEPAVGEIGEFWTFDLDHRQVEKYRVGRVFLVGDAAHVHTPFGGQGMNLGICDAHNLAWKLAAVVKGEAGDDLLDSYQSERHSIAEQVIRLTHLGASAMLIRTGAKATLRDWAFDALNLPSMAKRRMADQLSQLAHSYRRARAFSEKVGTGDRLPNTLFFDGYTSDKQRLHARIVPGVIHVVCGVEGVDPKPIDAWAAALAEAKKRSPVPLRAQIYSRFRIEERDRFPEIDDWAYDRKAELDPAIPYDSTCFVVRPDGFIGERNLAPTPEAILDAIDRIYARDRSVRASLAPLRQGAA